eukprot:CAMPEP_0119535748 /NCGR_PEP_ID=MMETSP1344-20130328/48748_1 /TAXON_ID=236787 /ORGANISM="Florenciella parvula, Strain CCMP2471" /LENGTH=295 /DNA_ID=CAMNT_0007577529 /DNA_START=192 /DNA_END=1081 /DNA_ORIENTATION=+
MSPACVSPRQPHSTLLRQPRAPRSRQWSPPPFEFGHDVVVHPRSDGQRERDPSRHDHPGRVNEHERRSADGLLALRVAQVWCAAGGGPHGSVRDGDRGEPEEALGERVRNDARRASGLDLGHHIHAALLRNPGVVHETQLDLPLVKIADLDVDRGVVERRLALLGRLGLLHRRHLPHVVLLIRERPIERTSGVERPSGWKAATAGMRAIRSAATFAMVQSCRRSSVQGLNDRVSTNFHEVLSNRQGALLTCSAAFFRRMSSSRFESCTVAAGSVTSLRLISIVQGNGNEKLKFLV